jgi:uncharacterized protein YidB (DUF937 family)
MTCGFPDRAQIGKASEQQKAVATAQRESLLVSDDRQRMAARLAQWQVLPGIVDKLTPNGKLPTAAELSQKM